MAPNGRQNTNDAAFQEINTKLNTIIQSLALQDTRIKELEVRIDATLAKQSELDTVKAECRQLKESIKELKSEARKEARNRNRKKISISGIPRNETESLASIISNVGNALKIQITSNDIKEVYRRRDTPRGPGEIIAKMSSITKRDQILKAAKTSKLSLNQLNMTGPSTRVYINSPLDPETKKILYQIKQLMPIKGWYRTWVYGAEVYLIMEEGGARIKIESLEDLSTLIQ